MGKKNRKNKDNYWDEEFEKDQVLVQEEVEKRDDEEDIEVEEEEDEIEVEEYDNEEDDEEDENIGEDEDGENKKDLPEDELSYTHGELDAAIAQIKYWILQKMKNNVELPTTRQSLGENIAKFCVIPRKFPIEAVIACLLEIEVLEVKEDEEGKDPKKKDIAFAQDWKKKCNSKKTKQFIKDQPPYYAHSYQQILDDVMKIESPPETSQQIVELLSSFTTLNQNIPPEEVIDELIEKKLIILEKRPIGNKSGKKSIEIEKIVYNEEKLKKVEKKGGMNVGLMILVGLMLLAGILGKFL